MATIVGAKFAAQKAMSVRAQKLTLLLKVGLKFFCKTPAKARKKGSNFLIYQSQMLLLAGAISKAFARIAVAI
jgi:hypothetical protein